MNIVGFGDSFILGLADTRSGVDYTGNIAWNNCYQGMIGDHFKCIPEFKGFPGSGPWAMFFDFLRYDKKDEIDVVIMAWSEIARLYHPKLRSGNVTLWDKERMNSLTDDEKIILNAAKGYMYNLGDEEKLNYEMRALMMMVDDMTKQYPHIKFIHLPCFTWLEQGQWWGRDYHTTDHTELRYHHDFKNGMEIRPALMYMSMLDDWPDDLSNDRRECHMTPRVNRLLADSIIHCIENYEPGKLIEMDISSIK
jgi:hypothetical protein